MHVDAGSQMLIDERARDRLSEVAHGNSGQDKNDVRHRVSS